MAVKHVRLPIQDQNFAQKLKVDALTELGLTCHKPAAK